LSPLSYEFALLVSKTITVTGGFLYFLLKNNQKNLNKLNNDNNNNNKENHLLKAYAATGWLWR